MSHMYNIDTDARCQRLRTIRHVQPVTKGIYTENENLSLHNRMRLQSRPTEDARAISDGIDTASILEIEWN